MAFSLNGLFTPQTVSTGPATAKLRLKDDRTTSRAENYDLVEVFGNYMKTYLKNNRRVVLEGTNNTNVFEASNVAQDITMSTGGKNHTSGQLSNQNDTLTINKRFEFYPGYSTTNGYTIDLDFMDGDDKVNCKGLGPGGQVRFNMGQGNDSVSLGGRNPFSNWPFNPPGAGSNVQVDLGQGNDEAWVNPWEMRDTVINVDGGSGVDSLWLIGRRNDYQVIDGENGRKTFKHNMTGATIDVDDDIENIYFTTGKQFYGEPEVEAYRTSDQEVADQADAGQASSRGVSEREQISREGTARGNSTNPSQSEITVPEAVAETSVETPEGVSDPVPAGEAVQQQEPQAFHFQVETASPFSREEA